MRKFLSFFCVFLAATSMLAQSGLTCEDPIPVDSNYVGNVPGEGYYWYTAGTYDLPLHFFFRPTSDYCDISPELVVDFTCTPGVYADKKLDSVINTVADFGIELPIEFMCERLEVDGKVVYDLSLDKRYREQLAECGITYNVPAYVQVYFPESGEIILRPDTAFSSCIENAEKVQLNDTIDIQPNDSNRVFVMPYSEWKNDSIRFVWVGDDDVRVWLASQECKFTPITTSAYVWDYLDISNKVPYKLYQNDMEQAIINNPGGGVFYSKILAPCAGKLVVEKIPENPPAGNAILLEYGRPVHIAPNDRTSIYAIPKTWNKATKFVAGTNTSFSSRWSNLYLFDNSKDGVFLVDYQSSLIAGESGVFLTTVELQQMTNYALDNFVYIQFLTDVETDITPILWDVSECVNSSFSVLPETPTYLTTSSKNNVYRLFYNDIAGAEVQVTWTGSKRMNMYMADTCVFAMSSTAEHVFLYKQFARALTTTYAIEKVEEWATYVDDEGYLYIRFNPNVSGEVVFSLKRPAKPDPIYVTIKEEVCFGESYTWNGQTYSATGEYQQTFVAANGADSIVTLQLTVRPEVPATEEHVTVAYGETHTWNGVTYTDSGSYSATLQDAFGCDSVVTLHLTVLPNPNKTELYPNDYMILNLASAFKVFTMEHLSWVAQDVNIHWGGTSPLYVFIASENDFALTPYNRYVLHYEEIAAGGDWVLTAAQMASWAQHAAAAGGKVYVRFLTEFEGELTTKGL